MIKRYSCPLYQYSFPSFPLRRILDSCVLSTTTEAWRDSTISFIFAQCMYKIIRFPSSSSFEKSPAYMPKKFQFLEAMKRSKARAKVYSSWTLNSKTEAPFAFIRISKAELPAVTWNCFIFFLFWLRPSSLVLSHTVQVDLTTNVPSSSRASRISNRSSSPPASKALLLKNFYSAKNHTPLLLSQLDSNKSPQTPHNFSRRRKPSSETLWVWHWRGQLLSCSPKTAPRSM